MEGRDEGEMLIDGLSLGSELGSIEILGWILMEGTLEGSEEG